MLGKIPFGLVALIQLPIIFYAIKRLGIPKIFGKPLLRNVAVWLSLFIFAVYLSIPSKEFINFLYVCGICYVLIAPIRLWQKIVISTLLFMFFGTWFRQYYILVPILAFGLFVIGYIRIRIKNKVLFNLIGGLLIACFLSLSYGFVKGEFMTQSFRERINKVRVGRDDSQTIITSPVPIDNIAGESISIFYGFFTVNFPVNSLKFFYKPQVMAFLFWQLLLFSFLMYFYNKCLKRKDVYKHEQWVFHLIFAYLIIQGVFEPDLGSAVKHKLGVFPLIYLAMYYDQGLLKYPKKNVKYVIKHSK